jgi:hypothetical protein
MKLPYVNLQQKAKSLPFGSVRSGDSTRKPSIGGSVEVTRNNLEEPLERTKPLFFDEVKLDPIKLFLKILNTSHVFKKGFNASRRDPFLESIFQFLSRFLSLSGIILSKVEQSNAFS